MLKNIESIKMERMKKAFLNGRIEVGSQNRGEGIDNGKKQSNILSCQFTIVSNEAVRSQTPYLIPTYVYTCLLVSEVVKREREVK